MVSIIENFWLDDWDESVLLADSGISGQSPGVFLDGQISWGTISGDLEDGSPLGESATQIVVFLAHGSQRIKSLGGRFSISSWDILETLIDLNSGDNSLGFQILDEVNTILGLMIASFLEQDNSGDVLLKSLSSEQQFSISSSVLFSILNRDRIESLLDSSS